MSLETVGKLVVQHSSSAVEVQNKIDKTAIEQALVRNIFNWLIIGMIILGIGVIMLVVNKNFEIGKWFNLLSTLIILAGCGVATGGVLNAIRRGASIGDGRRPNQKSLPSNPAGGELPSITERTTQLIPAQDAPTKRVTIGKIPNNE